MEKSSFFNSKSGDRKYKAEDWAEYFGSLIGNGVFPDPANGLQVSAGTGMGIVIKPGRAWINGRFYINTGNLNLILDNADGLLHRMDRVVLRCDYVERKITVRIKKGAFATVPLPQDIQRDADAYELVLADISVAKGAIGITQSAITDQRMNSSLCGICTGLIRQIDTADLFSQYSEAFNEWFYSIKGSLDGDTAGNLLSLINAKAPLNSPALTGTPTATTAENGDNSTRIATTAFVKSLGYAKVKFKTGSDFTTAELAEGEIGFVY